MIATEYLLLGAIVIGGVGAALAEVKQGIKEEAKVFVTEQHRLINNARQSSIEFNYDTRRTENGNHIGSVSP